MRIAGDLLILTHNVVCLFVLRTCQTACPAASYTPAMVNEMWRNLLNSRCDASLRLLSHAQEAIFTYGVFREQSLSRCAVDFRCDGTAQRSVRRPAHGCRLRHGLAPCHRTLCSSAPPDSSHRCSIVHVSRKTMELSTVCRGAALPDVLRVWLRRLELVKCAGMSGGCGLYRSPGRHRQRGPGNVCCSVYCRPHGATGRPLYYRLFRVISRRTLGLPAWNAFSALAAACGHAVLG